MTWTQKDEPGESGAWLGSRGDERKVRKEWGKIDHSGESQRPKSNLFMDKELVFTQMLREIEKVLFINAFQTIPKFIWYNKYMII